MAGIFNSIKRKSQEKMDKFVIKIPRIPKEKTKVLKPPLKQKQMTIESLPRVVVVEKIQHAKVVLSINDQSVECILSTLRELEGCTPSKKVLLETKIGHVVNRLRKHDNEQVQELSRKILKSWKGFYRELRNRQPIEVKCDLKTETFRKKARRLISQSLELEENSPLSELLERAVYMKFNQSINNSYRRLVRSLHMKLKNNMKLRQKVLNNEILPDELFEEVFRAF